MWVSRFIPDDVHHAESRDWLERHLASGRRILAPTLLLVEVVRAIARRTTDATLARRVVEALRGADAVYIAVADRLEAPLVTWNQAQLSRASAGVPTLTPRL